MDGLKTKSIRNIEEKIEGLEADSFRRHILESARDFKTSWIELGRSLYAVWKDKMFKSWGYTTFEAYTSREIGIRKQTALKLLKSYYFLEKEEPQMLQQNQAGTDSAVQAPSYESVDLLRMAKGRKDLDAEDYDRLKKDIFEKGRDAGDVKKDLTGLIRQRQVLDPQEAYEKKRYATIRRFLGVLKALRQEMEMSKLLSASIIKEAAGLISKIEKEIEE